MTELRRLLEETDSGTERALLQAGMSYRSSRETWAKTLSALGLAGSTAVVAGAATSAAAASAASIATSSTAVSAATLSPLAKISGVSGAKVLLALSAAGAATAVPMGYRALHHRSEAAIVAPRAPERHGGNGPMAERPTPPPALHLNEAPDAQPVGPAAARSRSNAKVSGPAAVSLTQELAALDAARAVLARGNAEGALFLLDGYDSTCPHGKLAVEAELLRIDALAKNGQSRDARHRAELFLKRHPSSLLASRARTYVED